MDNIKIKDEELCYNKSKSMPKMMGEATYHKVKNQNVSTCDWARVEEPKISIVNVATTKSFEFAQSKSNTVVKSATSSPQVDYISSIEQI